MQRLDLNDFLETTRGAKKIVVVDLGFLGDTIHLLPALWEIKTNYPGAELHVLTSPVGREVLQMAACVDRAWSFPLGPLSPGWWEHWDVLRAMRRERFDVAFNFSGGDRTVFVTAIIGARHAMAYRGARQHFWQPWLIRNWLARQPLPSPVYEGRRQMLRLCGLDVSPVRFDLKVPETERQWASENIPEGAVHLSLNASFALKEWPLTNNVQLLRFLLADDFDRKIVVSAAPNPREQSRLEQLRREITDARLVLINERLSVARLAAMLERCAMHIGPDSGVIHLASALNISTIAIFRRYTDMADFVPVGPKHTYFDAPCSCMNSKNPACAAANEAKCLGGISAELLGNEIRRRLGMKEPSRQNKA